MQEAGIPCRSLRLYPELGHLRSGNLRWRTSSAWRPCVAHLAISSPEKIPFGSRAYVCESEIDYDQAAAR